MACGCVSIWDLYLLYWVEVLLLFKSSNQDISDLIKSIPFEEVLSSSLLDSMQQLHV